MKPLRLEDLTVEQKLGQLLVARSIAKPDDFAFAMELIKNHALGGVQVATDPASFEACGKPVLETADYPIFIAADMERGCPFGDLRIPGNLSLGALNSPETVYEFARITATQAKAIGYNMIWSPVVDSADLNRPGGICRCMSGDKHVIASLAKAYMQAFADCGVVGSAKHYPSSETSSMDTHMAEGISTETREALLENRLYPYAELIRELGDDMMGVMVGHTRCVNIDPDYPASLSKSCIGLLRGIGFDGLLVTDSFAMMGVLQRFGDDKVLGLAVAAGNDLLLPNYRISLRESYNHLLNCWRAGMFPEERLNEAVTRVLRAQQRTLRRPAVPEITDADRASIARISRDCICAVNAPGFSSAIEPGRRHLFAVDMPNVYRGDDGDINEIEFAPWWKPHTVAERLLRDFPDSRVEFFCEFPSRFQIERICYAATQCDDVVFLTFSEYQAYQGSDAFTQRALSIMQAVQPKLAAIVHFGNPYALEQTPHAPRRILGFPSVGCIDAALDVLCGKADAKGTLPVTLTLQ